MPWLTVSPWHSSPASPTPKRSHHLFPSTTSMRSSAVTSLRRVTSALWILYSAKMLFTVSVSNSLCGH